MVKKTKKLQKDSGENIKKLLQDQTDKLVETFDDRMEIVKDQFKNVFEKIDNLSMDMTEVKRDIREVKLHVMIQGDTKLDKKHFVDLDQRVRRLEKK